VVLRGDLKAAVLEVAQKADPVVVQKVDPVVVQKEDPVVVQKEELQEDQRVAAREAVQKEVELQEDQKVGVLRVALLLHQPIHQLHRMREVEQEV
jgi:hypothetical protein